MKDSPYPYEHLRSLLSNVELVTSSAKECQANGVYERQWGMTVVGALVQRLCEITGDRGQQWRAMNVYVLLSQRCFCSRLIITSEDCRISPYEVLVKRPNNNNLFKDEPSGITFGDLIGSDTTEKRIDYACGLRLDFAAEEILRDQEYAGKATGYHSTNQMDNSSPYAKLPLFLSIELKRPRTLQDPCVQLAVWEASGFVKKGIMGWDTSMPVPGITVEGHEWDLYLFFKNTKGAIIMLGPQPLGNTRNVRATWELVFKLHKLVKWGQTDYARWFHTKVLQKASWTPPVPAPPFALG